jgi:hypothetical protein
MDVLTACAGALPHLPGAYVAFGHTCWVRGMDFLLRFDDLLSFLFFHCAA